MSKTKTTFWLIIAAAVCVVLAGVVLRQLPSGLLTQPSIVAPDQRASATQGGGRAVAAPAGSLLEVLVFGCALIPVAVACIIGSIIILVQDARNPEAWREDDM
ncbi:MAG: hypothetical protein KKD44_27925 [Proteobacteria bacterium]|nr:hypothetical protein [Pseudomonadota bacterium]